MNRSANWTKYGAASVAAYKYAQARFRRITRIPLFSKGQILKAVSAQLGHANPPMTLRIYSYTMPNDDANLTDGLARMMA